MGPNNVSCGSSSNFRVPSTRENIPNNNKAKICLIRVLPPVPECYFVLQ
jgi:hypothetical protein